MSALPVGSIFSVQILQLHLGVYGLVTHHFRVASDPFGLATLHNLNVSVGNDLSIGISQMVSSGCSVEATRCYEVGNPSVFDLEYPAMGGLVPGNSFPPFISFMSRFYPNVKRVKGGYTHVMGVPSIAVADGVFDPTFTTGRNYYAHFLSHLTTTLFVLLQTVIYVRPGLEFPSGGYRGTKFVKTVGYSTQTSRSGRNNASLRAQFGI